MAKTPKTEPKFSLDELKALVVAASAPFWHIIPSGGPIDPFFRVMRFDGVEVLRTWTLEDAEFVIAARVALPSLIAELERVTERLEEAEDLLTINARANEPIANFKDVVEFMERK